MRREGEMKGTQGANVGVMWRPGEIRNKGTSMMGLRKLKLI